MDSRPVPGKILRFGVFELDPETQQLRKAGVLLHLQPQPFKVLSLLISRAGHLLTREELRHELWGDEIYVDFEQGLNYCIRQIRAVLEDDAQTPRYIETIIRRGYRFIGPILTEEPPQKQHPMHGADGQRMTYPRRHWRVLLVAVALFALIATVAYIWKLRFPRHLSEKDTIVLLDFANNTGDPVFDHTLKQGLSIQLEQSPFLNLLSDQKARETLKMMRLPRDAPLTMEVGGQVCQRTGSVAVIVGTIQRFGTRYVLGLDALDCRNGDSLGREQVQAARKEDVLKALGEASAKLREKLGESLSSIQKFDTPIEQATTPSLEALQYFTLGSEKRSHEGAIPAIPFFQRAIQIDPDFALAHARLGVLYHNVEQLETAEEHEKKALALSDHVSERERLYIAAHYYGLIGQMEEEIQTYETYSRLYPRDPLPHSNLAREYNDLGQYDKALEHGLEELRLSPGTADTYINLSQTYRALGRPEEARAVLIEGIKHVPDSSALHLELSNVALAQGDTATREKEDALLGATPEGTLNLVYRDAALAVSHGELRNAQKLYYQAKELALKLQLKDNASFAMALRAVYESYLLEPTQANKSATTALQISQMKDTIPPAAMALAASGEERQAETLIQQLAKRRPKDTLIQFIWVPTVQAIISLRHGNAEQAVQILSSAVPYDRANLDPRLARGNALLRANHATEAVAEFGEILRLRTRYPEDPACALAQLGLARSYVLADDKVQGRAAYEQFLTLWKDADSDIPILIEAKAEYAKLP
jgi:DNA-binding winged helix-turn-helix (wHTH) protein/tetratricopeptide (TPR) repeat protein